MKSSLKKAFSLVEISIVILIVGILIAGVSKAIDLVSDSKLNSARSITKGSQILRIPNIVLWLETSSAESWPDNKRGQGEYYNTANKPIFWNDLNKQISNDLGFKFLGNFYYKEPSFGTLPTLKTLAAIDANKSINYSNIFDENGFTIFAVVKPVSGKSILKFCPQTSNITTCTGNAQLFLEYDASKKAKITFTGATTPASVVAEIASLARDGGGNEIEIISALGNDVNVNLFSNGIAYKNSSATPYKRQDYLGFFNIGSDATGVEYYEIIVFGSFLSDNLRYKVQSYLAEKYGVKLPQNPFVN
ncbi:MAG: prepilin-type N-terminal cleavage/methylation domain-containing protein [Alphaproteobacteria bacterium]